MIFRLGSNLEGFRGRGHLEGAGARDWDGREMYGMTTGATGPNCTQEGASGARARGQVHVHVVFQSLQLVTQREREGRTIGPGPLTDSGGIEDSPTLRVDKSNQPNKANAPAGPLVHQEREKDEKEKK